MTQERKNLEQLLNHIGKLSEHTRRVSMDHIVEAVGNRSFDSLLIMAGVILFSPLSGIPGIPTTMGIFVLLIAVQLLLGKKHFWLPRWLLKRSVAADKLDKAVNRLQRPARFIDRWLQPRFTVFISGMSRYVIGVICLIIAVCMPVMELVPFSASSAGLVITIFGLALLSHDGLMALIALVLTAITFGLIIYPLIL